MTIFEYFDKHITIKLDKAFAKDIYRFTRRYVLRDNAVSEFYGSQMIGVYPITFKSSLETQFLTEILGVDRRDLMADRKNTPSIIPSRKITGDVFNLAFFYLARRIEVEDKLPKKIRIQCQRDLVLLFCYRSMSALHNKYFSKYLIPSLMGTRVVDALSDLFILKRLGSWRAYMDYRVDKVYDNERKEYRRLMTGDDDDLLSVVVKTQGAIRSTIKAIYAVYLKIKDDDNGETKRSVAITIGDDEDIADITTDVPAIITKTLNKITARDAFVRTDLIDLICSEYVAKFKPAALTSLLNDMHKSLARPEGVKVLAYIRAVMAYELHITRENLTATQLKDPAYVVKWIRGVVTSSRSRNQILIDLRDEGSAVIRQVSGMSNRHYLVKARIAIMLYILLLTY